MQRPISSGQRPISPAISVSDGLRDMGQSFKQRLQGVAQSAADALSSFAARGHDSHHSHAGSEASASRGRWSMAGDSVVRDQTGPWSDQQQQLPAAVQPTGRFVPSQIRRASPRVPAVQDQELTPISHVPSRYGPDLPSAAQVNMFQNDIYDTLDPIPGEVSLQAGMAGQQRSSSAATPRVQQQDPTFAAVPAAQQRSSSAAAPWVQQQDQGIAPVGLAAYSSSTFPAADSMPQQEQQYGSAAPVPSTPLETPSALAAMQRQLAALQQENALLLQQLKLEQHGQQQKLQQHLEAVSVSHCDHLSALQQQWQGQLAEAATAVQQTTAELASLYAEKGELEHRLQQQDQLLQDKAVLEDRLQQQAQLLQEKDRELQRAQAQAEAQAALLRFAEQQFANNAQQQGMGSGSGSGYTTSSCGGDLADSSSSSSSCFGDVIASAISSNISSSSIDLAPSSNGTFLSVQALAGAASLFDVSVGSVAPFVLSKSGSVFALAGGMLLSGFCFPISDRNQLLTVLPVYWAGVPQSVWLAMAKHHRSCQVPWSRSVGGPGPP